MSGLGEHIRDPLVMSATGTGVEIVDVLGIFYTCLHILLQIFPGAEEQKPVSTHLGVRTP